MLDQGQRNDVVAYLGFKSQISQANDQFLAQAPRLAVPALEPAAAAAFYFGQCGNPYTGDPLWGVVDFYTNPTRLYAALKAGPEAVKRLFIDCDDVAGLYHAMVRQLPGYTSQVYTLIDEHIVGSHVIAVYTGPGGSGILDVCGHTPIPSIDETVICAKVSELFVSRDYRYIAAIPSPYPF